MGAGKPIRRTTIMSEPTHTTSNREQPPKDQANKIRKNRSHAREGTGPDLQIATVEYDERPNRGTIHPPNLTGIERMETWISVDMSMVADLSMWR